MNFLKRIKRVTAISAVIVILLSSMVFCYADSYDTVNVTSQTDYKLNYSNTAVFSAKKGTYTKKDKTHNAKVYTVEASPKTTSIVASSGKSHYGSKTLSDIIAATDIGDKRVAAAINADFFDMKVTGLPFGVQFTNGRIVATNLPDYDKSQGRVSVGFKADGSTVFGTPEFDMSVTIDDFTVKIDKINRQNTYTNHVLLFNSDYGTKTYWGVNEKGTNYDVIVLKTDDDLTISDEIECYFDSFLQNLSAPVDIEKGKLYICAPTGYFKDFKEPMTQNFDGVDVYTDTSFVTIKEKTGKWQDVINAVGGGNLLVNNGEIRYPSTYDSSIKNIHTSRTAFGVKADGTYIFYTVERSASSGAAGVWMDAVAQAMFNMGCVYAVNLDGGGSTTVIANTGSGVTLQNKCQDGSQRKVANALLLLTDEHAPVVIEDYETEKQFTEIYGKTNLITATVDKQNAYTGTGALKLDYSLAGLGNSVGVDFEPVDISKYKFLSIATNAGGAGVIIQAKLKNGEKIFWRDISDGLSKEYVRSQIDVSDATTLLGFTLTYKLAAKNKSTVFIDRVVGLTADMSGDVTSPQLTVTSKDGKVSINAIEPAFTAGVDSQGAEVIVDGGELLRTNIIDTATYSNDKIHKAKINVTDTLGNRALSYQLFKSPTYAVTAPFADLNDKKWDALAIRYCYENGIVNGIKEDGVLNYKGSKNVTRAEFCVMAVGSKKLDVNKYVGVTLPYADVADIPKWALLYVKAAYAEGIMTGSKTENGVEFFASADITRQETASVVDRLVKTDTRLNSVTKYGDEATFAKWSKKYIESATKQGLFTGDENGNFLPTKNLSRSEAAVVMSRL